MAVKLRLMRMGKKKQPTYRIVAADSRSPRDGRFIEILGHYDARRDPSVIKVDNDRAVHWLEVGAQPTETVEKLLTISGAIATWKGEPLPADAENYVREGHMVTPPEPAKKAQAAPQIKKAPDPEPEAEPEAGDDAPAADAADAPEAAADAPEAESADAPADDAAEESADS